MGIHKSQRTLMSHDNRGKKRQWHAASAKADIAYGKNWPNQLLFVFFHVRNNAACNFQQATCVQTICYF